jgi:tetratricopeptide (TPR) repeat protein/two-component sensor histidine kinase
MVTAQQAKDSLLAVLKTNPPDTAKIDIYLALHKQLFAQDTTLAKEYVQKAIVLSESIDDNKRFTIASTKLAYFYLYHGKISNSLVTITKAEKLLPYFRDMGVEAEFFKYRGITHNFSGNYDVAVNDLLKASSLYESLGDSTGLAHSYLNLGISNMDLKNYDKALEYYQKSLDIYQAMGDEKRMGNALGNIGIIYKEKNDYDQAIYYYNQSLQINEKNGFMFDARMDLNNLGVLYEEMGDFEKALELHQKSKEIADSLGLPFYILTSAFNLALVEYRLKNYTKSITALRKIVEAAEEKNYKAILERSYKVLSDSYEATGNLALALSSRKQYEIWKDSLMNENHLNQVAELQTKYETEKKEKQIVLLAQAKELQEKETQWQATLKKASLGGLFAVLLLGGLFIQVLTQRIKNQKLLTAKNEEIKEVNFKRQLSELEMKALRAQINPHFLFNCMNSINRMVLNGETENASRYLTKFAKLVRQILENSELPTVSLENELAMLESYIQLEALRFKGKINYEIVLDESINPEDTYLPSMVLQPFVENAIWHGLMHKETEDKGMITIAIKEDEDRLLCTIEDNGVGREMAQVLREKSVLKSKSMGMKITEERLRLLSKEQLAQLIRITDLKDAMNFALGTRVDISIPIS